MRWRIHAVEDPCGGRSMRLTRQGASEWEGSRRSLASQRGGPCPESGAGRGGTAEKGSGEPSCQADIALVRRVRGTLPSGERHQGGKCVPSR